MSATPDAARPELLTRAQVFRDLAWSRTPFLSTVIAVAVLAVIPLVWRNDYIISLLTLIFIYAIMTQSWNITIGFCGIWNFGQLAIIALGGYAAGLMNVKLGLNPWLTLPVGMIGGGIAAVIMVLPSIRLRGIYASMLTFAFAEVVRLLIIADNTGFTGGPFGLSGIDGLFDGYSPQASLRLYFWLTLVIGGGVMLLMHRMMNSPFGMGLVGQRESIRFSIGMGINRRALFIAATVVSGLIGGLAGALYATFYHSILPTVMGLAPMGLLVTMVVVGGLGTVRGPIVGTFLVMIVSELLRDTVMWRLVVQGVILLVVLAFFPAGVDSLAVRGFRTLREWMAEEKGGDSAAAEGPPGPAGSPPGTDRQPAAAAALSASAHAAETATSVATVVPAVAAGDGPAGAAADTGAVASARPVKKGGFRAWLNADQPPDEQKN